LQIPRVEKRKKKILNAKTTKRDSLNNTAGRLFYGNIQKETKISFDLFKFLIFIIMAMIKLKPEPIL